MHESDPGVLDLIRNTVKQFVQQEVTPYGYRIGEKSGEIPARFIKALVDMGIWGMTIPEEYGGGGMGAEASAVVAAELAYGWPSLHLVWSANNSLAGYPIAKFGTEEQKQRILPRLARAEILGCYGLTEVDAGSDVAAMRTKSEWKEQKGKKRPGLWMLNGAKMFITNAPDASVAVVFARISSEENYEGKRHGGITAFLLETDKPGLRAKGVTVTKMEKWGLLASPFAEVSLQDVEVPADAVLGERGRGFSIAMETLVNGRINIAAQSVGIARRALDEAVQYAKGRVQFGSSLMEKQSIAHALADLKARTEAAWQMTLYAAQAKDGGDARAAELSSQAKYFASETALQAALYCYRVHGGVGYTTVSIAMRLLHDSLATVTYEGASNIQLEIISRGL